MNISDIFNSAVMIPMGTPQFDCAMAVCAMRQLDPFAHISTPWGALPRWQHLILEQLLLRLAAV